MSQNRVKIKKTIIAILTKLAGLFVSPDNVGDTMHVIRPRPQRFSCVQPTGHILYGIFLKFGMCIDMVEI